MFIEYSHGTTRKTASESKIHGFEYNLRVGTQIDYRPHPSLQLGVNMSLNSSNGIKWKYSVPYQGLGLSRWVARPTHFLSPMAGCK